MMLEPGIVLWDRYKIIEQIGRGGMSRVFLVVDVISGERKALKETRRTAGEAGTGYLKKLSHSGLPRVDGIIHERDRTLIIMEYVSGCSLQDVLFRCGAQPYVALLNWMMQLCVILSFLHTQNPPIIYRDLKPSNVILQPGGDLKLIDFGAAREYRPGEIEDTVLLGTRGYAAPEQYGGYGQTDPRTDIYGLGATIYHLATNRDPSKPPYMRYPVTRWVQHIPNEFSRIVQKCTNLIAEKRYQNCDALMEDLLALREGFQYISSIYKENIRQLNNRYVIETDITVVYTDQVLS